MSLKLGYTAAGAMGIEPGTTKRIGAMLRAVLEFGMPAIFKFSLVILSLLLAQPVHADSWLEPEPFTVESSNGNYLVRIIPGRIFNELPGGLGIPPAAGAAAQWYEKKDGGWQLKQQSALSNRVAPVGAYLSNQGVLITLDNWYSVGFGRVIAVYAPTGKLLREHSLADLYDANDQLPMLPRSVSSIWWRCNKREPRFLIGPPTLAIDDALGGLVLVNLETGEAKVLGSVGACRNS